jgi:PKHD-type hydroxylase
MEQQSTYMVLEDLLNKFQLHQILGLSNKANYEDGRNTATDVAKEVKNNLQMNSQSAEYMNIQQTLMTALNQNALFRNAVFPLHVYPFLISKYKEGMEYGWHVDSPIMGNMMRTDIAMTIFLNDPSEYEGGELELQSPTGSILYKLKKGDAVCYPCTQVHRVRKVTAGERHVAVTWIQSMVKATEQRTILFDMYTAIESLKNADPSQNTIQLLQQCHSNLLRMWC